MRSGPFGWIASGSVGSYSRCGIHGQDDQAIELAHSAGHCYLIVALNVEAIAIDSPLFARTSPFDLGRSLEVTKRFRPIFV